MSRAPWKIWRQFYPATVSVTAVSPTSKPKLAWNTAGCGAQYSSDGTKEYICDQ